MSRQRREQALRLNGGGGTGITSGVSWDLFDFGGAGIIAAKSETVYGEVIPVSAFERHIAQTININDGVTSIMPTAFGGCVYMQKIWIPLSCIIINDIGDPANSPFSGCNSNLTIYCEAESKPAGWGTYWNYYDEENELTVVWGTSKAAFDAL